MSFDPITYAAVKQIKFNDSIKIPRLSLTSTTLLAPITGKMNVYLVSGGGSGALGSSGATGGASGSWGFKSFDVTAGDEIVLIIGAGGTAVTAQNTAGNRGGNSTITVGGVTYTVYGGDGGVVSATTRTPAPLPSEWDYGAASVDVTFKSGYYRGGAGLNVLMLSDGVATTALGAGGGGSGSPSLLDGTTGGGALPGGYAADGTPPQSSYSYIVSMLADLWILPVYGGAGGALQTPGGNGGGGGGGSNAYLARNGGIAGGGGATNHTNGNAGGFGGLGAGGGGGSAVSSGAGGNGFASITFVGE